MREASALIYKAGNWAEGQHNRPLAVPKICFGLERQQILTAAPSSPCFICHRQRVGDYARHAVLEGIIIRFIPCYCVLLSVTKTYSMCTIVTVFILTVTLQRKNSVFFLDNVLDVP